MNKEYNMATALLQFKKAYSNLVACSKAMPNLDVSKNYPFYLLDFEEIEPAVAQWCNVQAAALFAKVPDRVVNPACLSCAHFKERSPVKCSSEFKCINYPEIPFSKEAVSGILLQYLGLDIAALTDNEAFARYAAFILDFEKR